LVAAAAGSDFGVSIGDGRVMFGVGGGNDPTVVSANSYADGTWHSVVAARKLGDNVSEIALYVDGVNVGTKAVGTASLTALFYIDIGRLQTGEKHFTGELRNVRVTSEAMDGDAAPANRKWIYDRTLAGAETPEKWDEVCGDIFWSTYASTYDWPALLANGSVSGCVGGICRKEDGKCESCKDATDGCTLDFNLYATDLVQSSQVRVANILKGFGKASPREQVREAKRQLGYMVDGLDAYKNMTAPYFTNMYSSAGLVDTQIATIKGVSNALGVWAQGMLQGNSSGFVPSFNLDFYQQQLGLYFKEFKLLLKQMKTAKTLSEINSFIKEKHAIDASAKEATTKVSMDQTIQTIESAASGMSSALVNMKRLNGTIVDAGFKFQDTLDDYYAQKRRQAIWKLAFSVANLCTGSIDTFAGTMKGTDWKGKDGAEGVSSVGKFANTFGDKARKTQKAATALIKANGKDDANDEFPSSDAFKLTKKLSDDLADNDVPPIPDDIPDGSEMAVLQDALDNLNEAYSSL